MIISPLIVYLVLQADHIRNAAVFACFTCAVLLALTKMFLHASWDNASSSDEKQMKERALAFRPVGKIIGFCISGFMFFALIPSTGTLAGSFIAPLIVNSGVIQKDIPELYTLGVDALKRALAKPDKSQ